MKNKIKILVIIIGLITTLNISAAVEILRLEINPLNRGIITFSELPKDIKSSISADKKSISVKFSAVKFPEKVNQINGSGIIKTVSLTPGKKEITATVTLNDKRGYSIIPLPYSNSILIDVFDWNSLSKPDEDYRMGLMAIESRNYKLAEKFFDNAIKQGNVYASFQQGLIYLRNGDYAKAIKNLQVAENKDINVNDVYAALAQAYKESKNTAKENYYQKIFEKKTGIKSISYLAQENILTGDSLAIDNDSILNIFGDTSSNPAVTPVNTSNSDTSPNVITPPNPDLAKQNEEFNKKFLYAQDSVEVNFLKYLIYGFIGLSTLSVIVILAYFRWKNKKKSEIARREKAKKFTADLNKATSKYAPQPAVGNLLDKVIEDNEEKKTEKSTEDISDTYNPLKLKQQKNQKNNHQNIIDLAQEILKNKQEQNKEGIQTEIVSNPVDSIQSIEKDEPLIGNDEEKIKEIISSISDLTDNFNPETTIKRSSIIAEEPKEKLNDGKFDLALKLKDHEMKRKLRELDDINIDFKYGDKKAIIDRARAHKIEKAGIEVKANLYNIENNKEKLAKLSAKFAEK